MLTDGVAVIHQSLSTPALPILSHNEFAVKVDGLFIPRVSLSLTVWRRDEADKLEEERHENGSWRAESFIESRQWVLKPRGTDLLSPVLAVSHFLPPPSPPSSLWHWPHSAEAVTGWMASRLAVMLLKARGLAMSQLWGDRALPLAGCHVGPVT